MNTDVHQPLDSKMQPTSGGECGCSKPASSSFQRLQRRMPQRAESYSWLLGKGHVCYYAEKHVLILPYPRPSINNNKREKRRYLLPSSSLLLLPDSLPNIEDELPLGRIRIAKAGMRTTKLPVFSF